MALHKNQADIVNVHGAMVFAVFRTDGKAPVMDGNKRKGSFFP
jgi:hypothetical protein